MEIDIAIKRNILHPIFDEQRKGPYAFILNAGNKGHLESSMHLPVCVCVLQHLDFRFKAIPYFAAYMIMTVTRLVNGVVTQTLH